MKTKAGSLKGKSKPSDAKAIMKVFGWKKIGEYLGCDPRTAQYQEKENGLPINRLPGKPGRVYSTTEALERWMSGDKKNTRDIVLNFNLPVMHVNISIGPPVGGMIVFALGVPGPK
jgi:hypothetical protein